MRLSRVELVAYGAFVDRAVDLGPGLSVVYGPNESGKSTLRYAIADLLWGIQPRSHPYAFLVAPGQLRVRGTVVRSKDEEPATVEVDSRGYHDQAGGAVAPWWRGGPVATREAWSAALGLDVTALRSGGRSVLDDGGDLAALLFRARTGIDVSSTVEGLQAKADDLYRRRAGVRKAVREALGEAQQAREATRTATSSAADVERLRRVAQQRDAEWRKVDARYAALDGEFSAAQEAHRAWEPAVKLNSAVRRLAQLGAEGRILDDEDLEALRVARQENLTLTGQIAALDEDLANIAMEIGKLVVDEAVMREATILSQLAGRKTEEQSRIATIEASRGERDGVGHQIRRLLDRLDPGRKTLDESVTARGEFRAEAKGLLVGADVADRLNRAAAAVLEVGKAIVAQEAEITGSQTRLTSLDTAAFDPEAATRMVDARQKRQDVWQEIRELWISGVLPDPAIRSRLGTALDDATGLADDAADAVTATAEGTGRILEINAQLDVRRQRLAELHATRRTLEVDWAGIVAETVLPPIVDPQAWEVRRDLLEQLADLLEQYAAWDAKIVTDEAAAAVFARDVQASGSRIGITAADTWVVLEEAVAKVALSKANETALGIRRKDHAKSTKKRATYVAELAGHEAVLARLAQEDDLETLVARSKDGAGERAKEVQFRGELQAAARAGSDLDGLAALVSALTETDVRTREEQVQGARDQALQDRDDAREALAVAQRELHAAERDGNAAEAHAREVEAAEVLAGEVRAYLQIRMMIIALQRLVAAEEPEHDSALLTHAASLAARLTQGRVTGLTVEEENGARRLRIEATALEEGVADELSEGTADQVYLALRLAGIRQTQELAVAQWQHTLPVVLDDVLMTHDDERATSALRVMMAEAESQQIVLMTHHRSVATAAAELGATVVNLDHLPDLTGVPPAPRSKGTGAASPAVGASSEVRAWARAQGIEVGERGIIRGWILEAYANRDLPDVVE